MDIYKRLPADIKNSFFRYFQNPVAYKLKKFHFRPKLFHLLLYDIKNYRQTLDQLYIDFGSYKAHDGEFGWAPLLNHLWVMSGTVFTEDPPLLNTNLKYYKIWKRLKGFDHNQKIRRWIGSVYATKSHKIQIRTIWAVFTPQERQTILKN